MLSNKARIRVWFFLMVASGNIFLMVASGNIFLMVASGSIFGLRDFRKNNNKKKERKKISTDVLTYS